jgi:hypothetical protein
MKNWINKLENSMKECALDGVSHSFKYLLNANKGDELNFARIILEKMSEEVPSWSNKTTMNTDLKRIMQQIIVFFFFFLINKKKR